MKMSRQEEKATRFEIILEDIIRGQKVFNVRRNVYFKKSRYVFRQVDVCYDIVEHNRIKLVIVEAK